MRLKKISPGHKRQAKNKKPAEQTKKGKTLIRVEIMMNETTPFRRKLTHCLRAKDLSKMANLTISMSKIRKILKMNSQGRSTRFIAAQIDSSRNTVRKYLAILKKSGFTFEEVNALNDKELEDLFGKTRENNQPSSRMQSMLRCFPHVDKELKKT